MPLTRETPPTTTMRGIWRALALGSACVLLVNALLAGLLVWRPINKGNQVVRTKFALAQRSGPTEVDWLLLGDSSCNQGLDPAVMEQSTGESAVNLCTIGNLLAAGDVWMLERWLENHPPPAKGIAVVHVYDVWSRGEERLAGNAWVVPGGPVWRATRPVAPGDWRESLEGLTGDWIPLYAQSSTVMRLLKRPSVLLDVEQPRFDERGYMAASDGAETKVRKDVNGHLRVLRSDADSKISEVNQAALSHLMERSHALGLDIVVLLAPSAESLAKEPLFQARVEQVRAEIANVVGEDNVHLEVQTFPDSTMENADHLTVDSAPSYSRWVAAILASR